MGAGGDTRQLKLCHQQTIAQLLVAALREFHLQHGKTQDRLPVVLHHSARSPGRAVCTAARHGFKQTPTALIRLDIAPTGQGAAGRGGHAHVQAHGQGARPLPARRAHLHRRVEAEGHQGWAQTSAGVSMRHPPMPHDCGRRVPRRDRSACAHPLPRSISTRRPRRWHRARRRSLG